MIDVRLRLVKRILLGGEEEIRTLDTVTRILPFQGSSFNHSDTSPKDSITSVCKGSIYFDIGKYCCK